MKKYTKAELCLIWLDGFLGLEYKHKCELYKYIKDKTDIRLVIENAKDYIQSSIGEKEYLTLKNSATPEYLKSLLEGLYNREIIAVTIYSEEYPDCLKQAPCAPLVLYTKGDISLLKGNNFAIVGSRRSLPTSIKIAENFTEELVDAGFIPVTGIAEGVDSAVIRTALAKKAKVISVLAGGFDNVYPKSNLQLVKEVMSNGLVICEYPPETVPKPFHFPVRNRIIAGLARGTLVVSGALKSGTLYTAEYAEEMSRDLFCIPYTPGVESGAICNELIKRGAHLVDSPKDILEFYGVERKTQKIELTLEQKQIIKALKDGETHVEKIAEKVGKRTFEIMPILSILEIARIVVKSGNVYGLTRNDLED